MSPIQKVERDNRFIETCLELRLLKETDAERLREVVGDDDQVISQTALQRGMLTPADVDIVHSLQRPKETVPGYEILNLVGRGGMGVVYRAKQLDLERIVALKIILIDRLTESNTAARFEREAKALARLQHPNIVQALNFGKNDGRYFFAMEYVPGPTCEQVIRDSGNIAAREVWSIVRQVASALYHAQGQNLIHRDIKPANLILVPPPEGVSATSMLVKLTDFGLAMFADQNAEQLKLTTGDKIMGSPAYMSPEQFGGRQVDFRSDMYSLGATAWHALFGVPPHQGTSIGALYQQKSERLEVDRSTLPISLPDDQIDLLVQLLDPSPENRPKSYEELIAAVDALGFKDLRGTVPAAPGVNSVADPIQYISEHPTLPSKAPASLAKTDSLEIPADPSIDPTRTVELASQATSKPRRNLTWLLSAAVLSVIIVSIVVGLRGRHARGERKWNRVVSNTPLFDGETLSGWDVGGAMVGAWNTVEAPDASTAMTCVTRQGALTRRLPQPKHPRISLFVWLQPQSGPVDIDFALDPNKVNDARGCLRLTGRSMQLGEKTSDFGELHATVESSVPTTVFDRFHVVDIERQPTDWYVFYEENFVGSIPIDEIGPDDAIRLVVHGSDSESGTVTNAFFADIQVYELDSAEP